MRKTVFIKNAAIMTACSVILRLLGIVFKVWVASLVGSEGMGLYSLVLSVYFLFSAFAASGICTAATRLCANNLSLGKDYRPVMKKCFFLTLAVSFASSLSMIAFSRPLSRLAVGDTSVFLCFCVLAFCLPAVGTASLIRGFFFAVRKASDPALSQIAEQMIRIILSYILVKKFIRYGAAAACLALVIGDTVSELICPLILYFQYKKTAKRLPMNLKSCTCTYKSIHNIALPLSAGRYLGLFLRTGENLLVPRALSKSGVGMKGGLSLFGSIKAMALPILLFPSGILSSVSTLLIPEISSSLVQKRYLVVKGITERIVKFTVLLSVIFSCIFAGIGRELGSVLYKNGEVGTLIMLLSPIVPLMYLDSVADGILKGLDCQKFSFFTGVADSFIRVVLIIFLLPRYGMIAFIGIMYFSNFFTAVLNTAMLFKKSKMQTDPIKTVFMPLCTALVITKATTVLLRSVAAYSTVLYILAVAAASLFFYAACLLLFGCVTPEEVKELYS